MTNEGNRVTKDPLMWKALAASDLNAAKHLVEGGHYRHALGLCQQTVEKALKMHLSVIGAMDETMSTHSLGKLAKAAGLYEEMSVEDQKWLANLSGMRELSCYAKSPYELELVNDADLARKTLRKAEQMVSWVIEETLGVLRRRIVGTGEPDGD